VTGGAPVTLCRTAALPLGAWWGPDDTILVGQGPDGIARVSANGGNLETIIKLKEGEQAQSPQALPGGGDWVLFTLRPAGVADWNQSQIVAQSIASGERRVLVNGGRDAHYVSTGHLVYALNGVLFAIRFDAKTRSVSGGPVSLVEGVGDAAQLSGAAQFSLAANGTLIYVDRAALGGVAGALRTFVWVDRSAHEEPLKLEPTPYDYPRISPDGTRLAYSVVPSPSSADVWVLDLQRGTKSRITFEGYNRFVPTWTPDGKRLIVSDASTGQKNHIRWAPADGGGAPENVLEGPMNFVTSVSPGRIAVFHQANQQTNRDLWVLPLDGDRKPSPFLVTPFSESGGAFSPDGRWLAYTSNKSGRNEVYVRPFPGAGAQEYTISVDGGTETAWSPNGRELFYRHDQDMMSVSVNGSGTAFMAAAPVKLFSGAFVPDGSAPGSIADYDVSRDGKRFLMMKPASAQTAAQQQVSVVLNWTEELKQRVPVK
jgi:hypothetical protein